MLDAGNSASNEPGTTGITRLTSWQGFRGGERLLVIIGLTAVMVGTLPGVTAAQARLLTVVCVLTAAAFAVLYVVRLRAAPDRRRFAFSVAAIIDLLAAAPVPLALVLGSPAAAARLFGILWALKLIRMNPAFSLLGRVLRNERQPLTSVAMAFAVIALFAATLAFLLERPYQPQAFSSIPASLWWTIVTITTTGYGDKAPLSLAGRILAAGVMVSGIGLFALWAGILASGFSQELRRRDFLESWDLVVRLPLFRGLGAPALAEIARLLKVQNCAAATTIVRQGQPGDSMFFIAEGEAEVRTSTGRVRLHAGQFFGEKSLISGEPRSASVVAVTPTRLLRLDVIDFRDLAARQPELLEVIETENARRTTSPGEKV